MSSCKNGTNKSVCIVPERIKKIDIVSDKGYIVYIEDVE